MAAGERHDDDTTRDPATLAAPGVRALFDELVELHPAARAERLRGLALPAGTLRELQALFAGDANPPALLDVPPGEAVARWLNAGELAAAYVGRRIGPFRVVEILGHGGSSVVFRAERESGGARQQVALKLLRAGLFSAEAQRRFTREHAILAQLTHPNIARLIEGGVEDSGIPFIAMELVEGTPITVHADRNSLPLRDRVRLVLTLCRAVEAAHAALVVHRDLKPSNVYVDTHGAVKVLDFGTAKLLDDDVGHTRTEAIVLTPAYAAPEQFRSGPVTTAADVYALGVLLGELLTGCLLGATTTSRASSVVTSPGAARIPSGLPQDRLLVRELRGDLDAIIATALAEEPVRRYRSAGALADDLERYLAGRPVQAHPPSRWYPMRKFAQRHRRSLGVASVLLLALLGALATALWQADVARRAAAAATEEAARADAMRDFMFDAFARTQPATPRAEVTVVEVVERGAEAALADRSAPPRARIELLLRLIEVLRARSKHDRAAALLATARQQAEATLSADDPLMYEIELGEIALLQRRLQVGPARERVDKLLVELPATAELLRAEVLCHSTYLAGVEGEFERGERDGAAAIALARRLGEPDLLVRALRALGSVRIDAGRGADAIPIYDELLAMQRARYGDAHVRVAEEEAALARAHRLAGHGEAALRHARSAVAIGDAAYPPDHWARGLHRNALVMALVEQRRLDEALEVQREALRLDRINYTESDPNLTMTMGLLGTILAGLERWNESLDTYEHALRLAVAQGGPQSRLVGRLRVYVGHVLSMTGRREEGEAELEQALAIARGLKDDEFAANVMTQQTRVALNAGDLVAARERLAQLVPLSQPYRARPMWPGRVGLLQAELALAQGDATAAQLALDEVAREIAAGGQVDPVAVPLHAVLSVAVARAAAQPERAHELEADARRQVDSLPFPPAHLKRIAAAAGID